MLEFPLKLPAVLTAGRPQYDYGPPRRSEDRLTTSNRHRCYHFDTPRRTRSCGRGRKLKYANALNALNMLYAATGKILTTDEVSWEFSKC